MIIEAIISTVVGSAISGVIGNRADKIAVDTMDRIIDNFNKNKRLINHDLQKAVLSSYYLALKSICEECLSKEKDNNRISLWLNSEINEIKDMMKKIEKNEYNFLPIEEFDKIRLLITTEGSASQEIDKEHAILISYALDRNCPPRCYTDLVKNSLYQRICGFFAFEIKHNQIINNIFQSQLLSNIDIKVNALVENESNFNEKLDELIRTIKVAIANETNKTNFSNIKMDLKEEFRSSTAEGVLDDLRFNVSGNARSINPYADFSLRLKQLTVIPPRDPNFIGREEIITDIVDKLIHKKSIAITAGLQGMGGIGKSSIIIEICNIFKENWDKTVQYPKYLENILEPHPYFLDGILWIRFEKEDTISSVWDKIYRQIGITKYNQKTTEGSLDICKLLLKGKDLLVVLDSAEQNNNCFRYFYDNLFNEFSVLVGSRMRCADISCSDVPIMDKEDAFILFMTYLKRGVKNSEKPLIYTLCNKVGYHPLAIKVIASRANVALKTLEEVVQEFDNKHLESLKLYEHSKKIENDVINCFSLSYDSLTESQRQVFTAAGIFEFSFSKTQLQKILQSENISIDEDLDKLVMFNLVNKVIDENSSGVFSCYNFHPLLREFALKKLMDFEYADSLWYRKQTLFQELLNTNQITEYEIEEALSTISWCDRHDYKEDCVKLICQITTHLLKAGLWGKEITLLRLGIKKAHFSNMLTQEIEMRLSLIHLLYEKRKYSEILREKEVIKALVKDSSDLNLVKNNIYCYLMYLTELSKAENIDYERLLTESFSNIRETIKNGFLNNINYRILGHVYKTFGAFDMFENCMECCISNISTDDYSHDELSYLLQDFTEGWIQKGEYKKALLYYEGFNTIMKKQKDIILDIDFLKVYIHLLIKMKDYKTAQTKLAELEKLYNKYDIDSTVENINRYKGEIALGYRNNSEAIKYFNLLANKAEKVFWLGVAYCSKGEYSLAEKYLIEAYSYYEQEKNPFFLAHICTYLADIELLKYENPNMEKAIKLLNTAKNTKKKLGVIDIENELEIGKRIIEKIGESDYNIMNNSCNNEIIDVFPKFILSKLASRIIASDNKEMVLIPEGLCFVGEGKVEKNLVKDFLTKSTEAGTLELSSGLCRKVYLYSYYIDKYPVTNGEYKAFCRATCRDLPQHLSDLSNSSVLLDSMPVFNITVESARAYAEWSGKFLPTQVEWEKACRGEQGLQYPWGDEWDHSKLQRPNIDEEKQELLENIWESTIVPFENSKIYIESLKKYINDKKIDDILVYRKILKKIFPQNKKFQYKLLSDHPGSKFDEEYYMVLLANMILLGYDKKIIYINALSKTKQVDIQSYIDFLEEAYTTLYDALKDYPEEKIEQLYENNSEEWRKVLAYKLFYDGNIAKPIGENLASISPFGVSDMIGNVMEMTDSKVDEMYIVKGGPYYGASSKEIIKASDSYQWDITNDSEGTSTLIGFRCVKPVFKL